MTLVHYFSLPKYARGLLSLKKGHICVNERLFIMIFDRDFELINLIS